MSAAMFMSVALGYLAGLATVFFVGRRIVAAILRGAPGEAAARRTVVKTAAAGAFVALLPALILGTVVGGTLGGAYGATLSRSAGGGSAVVLIGVALGMFAVAAAILCLAVALGAWLGRFIARH